MSTTLTGEAARCRRTLSAQSLGWSSFLNVVGVAAWIPCSGGVFKGAHPCLAALRALGWSGGRAPLRQTPFPLTRGAYRFHEHQKKRSREFAQNGSLF